MAALAGCCWHRPLGKGIGGPEEQKCAGNLKPFFIAPASWHNRHHQGAAHTSPGVSIAGAWKCPRGSSSGARVALPRHKLSRAGTYMKEPPLEYAVAHAKTQVPFCLWGTCSPPAPKGDSRRADAGGLWRDIGSKGKVFYSVREQPR